MSDDAYEQELQRFEKMFEIEYPILREGDKVTDEKNPGKIGIVKAVSGRFATVDYGDDLWFTHILRLTKVRATTPTDESAS